MNYKSMDKLIEERGFEVIGPEAFILREFAAVESSLLLHDLYYIIQLSPFRHMATPGGFVMSVATSNCGTWGWIADKSGYSYKQIDPLTGRHWPALPDSFLKLAITSVEIAGFKNFFPNACLINYYKLGSKLSLHQDKDEKDFTQPIVSVSLGLPAVFLFGGDKRTDKPARFKLDHGDVVVWGGASRLRYHGILSLKNGYHPLLGNCRINFTFRKAV